MAGTIAISHFLDDENDPGAPLHPLLLTFEDPNLERDYVKFQYQESGFYGGKLWHGVAVLINGGLMLFYHSTRIKLSDEMFFGNMWVGLFVSTLLTFILGVALCFQHLSAYREMLFLVSLVSHWPSIVVAAFFGMGDPWVYAMGFCLGCLFFCTFVVQARFCRVVFILGAAPVVTLTFSTVFFPQKYWSTHHLTELIFWGTYFAPLIFLVAFERQSRKNFVKMQKCMTEIADVERRTVATRDMVVNFFAPTPCADFLAEGKKAVRSRTYRDVCMVVTDIAGFTAWTSVTTEDTVVATLSRMFSFIDSKSSQYKVEKISTVGDCFIGAIFPCETPVHHRACDMLHFGCAIIDAAEGLKLRVGCHIGTIIASFIGGHPPKFDLFGEDFYIAKEMEHDGVPGKVHASIAIIERAGTCGCPNKPEKRVHTDGHGKEGIVFSQWDRECGRDFLTETDAFTTAERLRICQGLLAISNDEAAPRAASNRGDDEEGEEMIPQSEDIPLVVSASRDEGEAPVLNIPQILQPDTSQISSSVPSSQYSAVIVPDDGLGDYKQRESMSSHEEFSPSNSVETSGSIGVVVEGSTTVIATKVQVIEPSRSGEGNGQASAVVHSQEENLSNLPSPRGRGPLQPGKEGLLSVAWSQPQVAPKKESRPKGKIQLRRGSDPSASLQKFRPSKPTVDEALETASRMSASIAGSDINSFFSQLSRDMEGLAHFHPLLLHYKEPQHEAQFQEYLKRTGLLPKSEVAVLIMLSYLFLTHIVLVCLDSALNRLLTALVAAVIIVHYLVLQAKIHFTYHSVYVGFNYAIICIAASFLSVGCDSQSNYYTGVVISNYLQMPFLMSQFLLQRTLPQRFLLLGVAVAAAYVCMGLRYATYRDNVLPWDPIYGVGIIGWGFVSYFSDFSLRSAFSADEKLKLALRLSRGRHQVLASKALDAMLPGFVSHRLLSAKGDMEQCEAGEISEVDDNAALFDSEGLAGGDTIWKFKNVCVLFLSFDRGVQHETVDTVEELHETFSEIESILRSGQLHKIKTSGTTLLAVAGINDEAGYLVMAVRAALQIRERVLQQKRNWQFTFGLHCGGITGAVFGRKSIIFDIFGDTVNVASRMQSTAKHGCIQVSAALYAAITCLPVKDRSDICFTKNDPIIVKGKGTLETYDLNQTHPTRWSGPGPTAVPARHPSSDSLVLTSANSSTNNALLTVANLGGERGAKKRTPKTRNNESPDEFGAAHRQMPGTPVLRITSVS
jgi:class 3 adenylate cyclase